MDSHPRVALNMRYLGSKFEIFEIFEIFEVLTITDYDRRYMRRW